MREIESKRERERDKSRTILGEATPRFRFCVCCLVYFSGSTRPLLRFVLSPPLVLSQTHTHAHACSQFEVWLWLWLCLCCCLCPCPCLCLYLCFADSARDGNATVFSLWIFISRPHFFYSFFLFFCVSKTSKLIKASRCIHT